MKHSLPSRAFTLIELLITIAIIGLLTAIVVTSLAPSRGKARDAKRISDVSNIQFALSLYFDRCKQYPSTLTTGASNGCPTTPVAITFADFMPVVPTQPGGTVYDYAIKDSGGSKIDYILHTRLESYNDVIKDALPPSYSTDGTGTIGSGFSVVTGSSFTCTNTSPGKEYCIGSK